MLIIRWCEIEKTEQIPPFGEELEAHLKEKKGTVLHASCSAWNLLYRTLIENDLEAGEVGFTESCKPIFRDSNLFFSISHSHELCAVAISDSPVGVDIEIVKDHYNQRLVERSLCENEKAVFDGDFTRFWSRKEAFAKMTGKGITGYPVNIDTTKCELTEKRIISHGNYFWIVMCCMMVENQSC